MTAKKEELLVFIDGDCGLCNRSAYFLYSHERKPVFRFAGLQSNFAKTEFDRRKKEIDMNSVYLMWNDELYEKMSAYRIMFSFLKFPYNVISLILRLTPKCIGNYFYDIIVWNRHKLYPKNAFCPVDEEGYRRRFLLSLGFKVENADILRSRIVSRELKIEN